LAPNQIHLSASRRCIVDHFFRHPGWPYAVVFVGAVPNESAEQINLAFGTSIDKDVVRRILALRYQPAPDSDGPSWLTFLGHMKDSLWSLDLFRCESAALRTYWVLIVMDQYPTDHRIWNSDRSRQR
jgi:hypothetical protein